MRIEDAGARTWLLAAVALWAVCTWVLAAAGLGGRVQPLDEDPALLQPLPAGELAAGQRLGPLPQYAQIVDRPLFASDRRHRPFFLESDGGGEPGLDGFDVVLTSVLITPALEMAIVQPSDGGDAISFKVGESARQAPDWTLVSVAPRQATFAGPDGERTLEMRLFDGVGGQPPTPLDAGAAATAATATTAASSDAEAVEQATAREEADITPASQAEAIRRRIEARRARIREQRAQQQSQPQAPAEMRENP